MRLLIVSTAQPTVQEIGANIQACEEMREAYYNKIPSNEQNESEIVHQVLMLDEIAMEKQPRWDDKTNMFMGICREHGHEIPLEFCNEADLDLLCDALDQGRVHLASEVRNLRSIIDTWKYEVTLHRQL